LLNSSWRLDNQKLREFIVARKLLCKTLKAMHDLSSVLLSNTGRNIFVAICLLGVAFLVWFLIALLLDEKRMRRQQNSSRSISSVRSVQVISSRAEKKTPGNRDEGPTEPGPMAMLNSHETFPQIDILRLSDRQTDESTVKIRWLLMGLLLVVGIRSTAQSQNSTAGQPTSDQKASTQAETPAPSPLTTPAITGPLQAAPPIEIDAGPLGKLDLNGVVSGIGLAQGSYVAGDDSKQAALSNGQVFIQKTTGWWQFYLQAGAYNILALGTPFLPTDKAITDLYGPVPVAYVKLVPAKNTSILVGALPTLMGAEYTFDFENMNIERGLLWNQENAVNRGIQLNQALGKFTAALTWNDGYYSNRYSWFSGSLTYVGGPHSLSFIGMGNLGQTARQTLATPIQNDGSMYAFIYTYTKGNWIVQPYYQYSSVPTNPSVGVLRGASTNGGALLLSRFLKRGFSVAARAEYIASSGSIAQNSVNLVYGPGSSAWSFTLTPTFQRQRFFARGDVSVVRANSVTPGDAFGTSGTDQNQARGVVELGLLF
jgi:hypothetical protein